jgi:thiol-disulfide isomerase/thioredoxin
MRPHRTARMPMDASRSADRFLWALVAVAAGAVVVVAVARGRAKDPRPREVAEVASRISLPRLDGNGHASIQKGHVTVVDFWATWCAPCRVSMPRLQRVWRDYGPRGVDLYSVDTDEPGGNREAAVKAFLLENGLDFPVVLDDGTAARAFAIANLPTMLVLDRDARVVWNHVGALTGHGETELRGVLERVLSRPAAAAN